MSIARVFTVQRSRTSKRGPRSCEKCRVAIPAGDPYRHFTRGFRSHYQHVRCMRPTCTPRLSELESSRLSEVYSAIEDAQGDLDSMTEPGEPADVEEVVQNVGTAIHDVADAYREADEAFGGGGNTDSAERADTLEGAADELDGYSTGADDAPDFDRCEDAAHDIEEGEDGFVERGSENCEECSTVRQEWWDEILSDARDALDEVSV